jgi:hypothetical protein
VADNINVTPGTGKTIAADDVSGVLYQRIKVSVGADGVATDASVGNGVTDTGTLRVTVASDSTGQIKLAAGTNIAGKFGIDQTTDGTTNLVAAKQSGTWNVTNVSGTVSLPTGAATAAKQPALGTAGSASTDVISVQGVSGGVALPASQSGTWNVTNISGTVSLPTGAATAAKQPALGSAGSASTDVITVQGIASGTPLRTASSAETSAVYNGTTSLTPKFAAVVASASGVTTVIAAVTSKKIRVLALELMSNGTTNVKWQSHTTPTDLTGLAYLVANAGYVLPFCPTGWFETVSGEALDINLSAAIAVGGSVVYVEV